MKVAQLARAEEGQALVIVALAMLALMGALALTLDWGYGYVQRRGIQNGVDNAALAAGRHVASTFRLVAGARAFDATLEEICNEVASRSASLPGPSEVSFFSDPAAPGTWTTITTSNCAAGAGVPVPGDTSYVRVRSVASFRSLTQQTFTIGASARTRLVGSAGCVTIDCTALRPVELPSTTRPPSGPREGLSGYTTGPNVAIWPISLHLNVADFGGSPCGQYCDVTTTTPRNVWPVDRYGPSGQQFTGLLTFTHFSPREADDGHPSIHQFTTESDYTGTNNSGIRTTHDHTDPAVYPPVQMPNADLRACGGAPAWDTIGRPSLSEAASCDLPNWFAYGYRGSVGLGTDWSGSFNGLPGVGVARPTALSPSRASCDRTVSLARPSCQAGPANQIGDWVETAPGELTTLMANRMSAFVAKYGRVVPSSSTPTSGTPGAPLFGKAVVVFIPLWDCAQHINPGWDSSDARRWTLMNPTDCSQLDAPGSVTVDRVHIAAAVPFTFYEGLITSGRVQAYWGNVFGDAGICRDSPLAAGCALNEFMNSAFLVPDE